MTSKRCLILLALLLCSGRYAWAADEVSLLKLVDDRAAVCLEVPAPQATWSRFQTSQLFKRLRVYPPIERVLGGAGFQKWTALQDHVQRATGKTLSAHLLGACSESLVVAVYLPAGRAPEGVVLAQARDEETLSQTLQAWAKLEPQQQSQVKQHLGRDYVRLSKSPDSREVVYYVTFGRTIALSDQEGLIHQVIELRTTDRRPGAPGRLEESPEYQVSRSRLPDRAAARLYLNIRQWDQVILNAVGDSPDATWVLPVVRQISTLSLALCLDDEVVLDLVAAADDESLPDAWRQFVAGTKRDRDWNVRIPEQAIVALSSRLETRFLIEAWAAFAPEARSDDFMRGRNLLKSLFQGHDFLTEILPRILGDWTVAVVPAGDTSDRPLDVVGQFSLGEGDVQDPDSIAASVDHTLQFAMTAAAAAISHQRGAGAASPVLVKTDSTSTGSMRSLSGLAPWSPAYTVTSRGLTIASSKAALSATASAESSVPSRRMAHTERYFPWATQLFWLDAGRLRGLLAGQSDLLSKYLSPGNSDNRQRVRNHLTRIEEISRIFDSAFVAAGLEDDHVRIVLGVALDRSP